MASFAELNDDNIVIRVIGISNDVCGEPILNFPETCTAGRLFIANTLKLGGNWRQTSYSSSFRGTYAGTGYAYDPDTDTFIPPTLVTEE